MDKKRKILNNQQLTNVADDHEIRITKLETKKKKTIKKCGKGPKVTIADVMQRLIRFEEAIDQRFNKIENRLDKLETRIDKLETRIDKLETRIVKLETSVNVLNQEVQVLNQVVFKK